MSPDEADTVPFSLTGIFDQLAEAARDSDTLTLDTLLGTFGRRGLGVMLLLPCLLIILPPGLIPGVPAVLALLMIFIAAHMIAGRRQLWLPERIARVELPAAPIRKGLTRMRPYARRVDGWMGTRFAWFAESRFAHETVAVVTIFLSLLILTLGFLPGLPALLALAILVFALGLSFRNGLLILAGHASGALMVLAALWLL